MIVYDNANKKITLNTIRSLFTNFPPAVESIQNNNLFPQIRDI